MPFVQRDASGAVTALFSQPGPGHEEEVPAGHPDLTPVTGPSEFARLGGLHRHLHLQRRLHVDPPHPTRCGQMHRPGHQRNLGPGLACSTRHRKAHLARRMVGNTTHRVNGLERRPRRHQHTLAAQVGMIGPVSTIVLSLLLLGEPMGPWQVAGTVLVMAGVFFWRQ